MLQLIIFFLVAFFNTISAMEDIENNKISERTTLTNFAAGGNYHSFSPYRTRELSPEAREEVLKAILHILLGENMPREYTDVFATLKQIEKSLNNCAPHSYDKDKLRTALEAILESPTIDLARALLTPEACALFSQIVSAYLEEEHTKLLPNPRDQESVQAKEQYNADVIKTRLLSLSEAQRERLSGLLKLERGYIKGRYLPKLNQFVLFSVEIMMPMALVLGIVFGVALFITYKITPVICASMGIAHPSDAAIWGISISLSFILTFIAPIYVLYRIDKKRNNRAILTDLLQKQLDAIEEVLTLLRQRQLQGR